MATRILIILLFSCLFIKGKTQETLASKTDTVQKIFPKKIKTVSIDEMTKFTLSKGLSNAYEPFVQHYISNSLAYHITEKAFGPIIAKRERLKLEWIFYSFLALFLLLGFIRYVWKDYFDKVFLVYFNRGFILRQKKDLMMLWNLPSMMLNLLFVLSCGFFLFFGMGSNYILTGSDRWQVMIFILFVVMVVYGFKYFFLQFMGWMFRQKEVFDNYSFIVFLNNKIMGVLMLISSFVMAFSSPSSYQSIFTFVLYLIGLLFIIRLFNAFRIFAVQAKAGIFNFLLAFISVELLPTAILLKFVSSGIFLLTDGLL